MKDVKVILQGILINIRININKDNKKGYFLNLQNELKGKHLSGDNFNFVELEKNINSPKKEPKEFSETKEPIYKKLYEIINDKEKINNEHEMYMYTSHFNIFALQKLFSNKEMNIGLTFNFFKWGLVNYILLCVE